MTFPGPSAAAIAETQRLHAESDKRIKAAKIKAKTLERKAQLFPGAKYLPERARIFIQKHASAALTEAADAAAEARLDYQWEVYHKMSDKRPPYPRRRAISPSRPEFRRDGPRRQAFFTQNQSPFFARLPAEIRAEIYRTLFGHWIVEIIATHAGFGGPPPSSEFSIYNASRITSWTSGRIWQRNGGGWWQPIKTEKMTPWVVPLLRTCRRIYEEAITLLYAESIFKYYSIPGNQWTKCLLTQRLHTIRTVHFNWSLNHSWKGPPHEPTFEAFAGMKALRKLCIMGSAHFFIDGKRRVFIDAHLWTEMKDILLEASQMLDFIKDVDILLPIKQEFLVEQNDEVIGNLRLHGLTREVLEERKDVHCACKHLPEKMEIEWSQL